MNQLEKQKKKRLIINLCLVAVCIAILIGVILADQIANRKSDIVMTPESAQTQLGELLATLPNTTADCSKYVVEQTEFSVLSIEDGKAREFIAKVKYDTIDVAAMYEAHKEDIFRIAWEFAERVKAEGKKVNATLLQIEVEAYILEQMESGNWKTSGEVDVYFYDTYTGTPVMYMSVFSSCIAIQSSET